MAVCVSLAELAAAFPHSQGKLYVPETLPVARSKATDEHTGQVHWVRLLAPPRLSRALSYWTAAFTTAAWFFWTCGTYLFAAQLLFALVDIAHPSFTEKTYQVYLVYVGAAAFSILLNTALFRSYSYLLRLMVLVVNGGAILTMVVLLVRASPKRSALTVFVDFVNVTGWSSDGFVFLLGLLPGITALSGFDSATHGTDEVPDPARQVPQVMVGTAALAALAGLPMAIVYMFCVLSEENLLAPVGGQPTAQLFVDSTASLALSIVLMVVLVVIFFIASGALTTTMSRVLWSLAEDRQLVLSPWLANVGGRHQLPVNAIYLTAILTCSFGLLSLGPTTALNAIIGSAAVCFFVSYMIPLCCVLRNRSKLRCTTHYEPRHLGRCTQLDSCGLDGSHEHCAHVSAVPPSDRGLHELHHFCAVRSRRGLHDELVSLCPHPVSRELGLDMWKGWKGLAG